MSLSRKTVAAFTMDDVLGALTLRTQRKPKKLRSSLKRWLRAQYKLPITNGKWLCLFRPRDTPGIDHIRIGLLEKLELDDAVELIPRHSPAARRWLERFIRHFPLPAQKRSNRGPRNQLVCS